MTEDHRFYIAIVILVIIAVCRYPALLLAFSGKATARCRDGSLSYSAHRCGTCSHHRGVAEFFSA